MGHGWVVAQWNGATWTIVPPPAGSAGNATCITRCGSFYYIGDTSGGLWSYDGVGTWLSLGTLAQPVRGIWGSSANDVIV